MILKQVKKPPDFINLCTSALRRRFSTGPIVKETKAKAVVKGERGIRGGKMVRCFYCDKLIPQYKCEIEHIECVVPVFSAAKFMDIPTIFKRMYMPDIEPVCSCVECHSIKTSEELKMRVWWRKQTRYMVYETLCTANNTLYVGVHPFKKFDKTYIGEGRCLEIAIRKYGKSYFKMRVLKVFHLKCQAIGYIKFSVPYEIIKEM
jgi:hypothetical protein